MRGEGGFLQRTAERLEIPEDAMFRVPRVTLTGGSEVCVENHRGLLGYTRERIEVGGGRMRVRILGSGLELCCMTADTLIVHGRVHAVEIEQGTGGNT